MSRISIADLEVFCRVGVSDAERARPQRLLVTVELDFDFTAAATSDRIEDTINYHALAERLIDYGHAGDWRLLEKLATDFAGMILSEFAPGAVTVEVKKFPFPWARHVSVSVTRRRPAS